MYKMILFDVDGVILSEERYFDASALTVWEMLHSPLYLGVEGEFTAQPDEPLIRKVRKEVFDHDRALEFIKSRGINANWDMVYLVFSHQLISLLGQLHSDHPEEVQRILTGQIGREQLEEIRGLSQGEQVFVPDYSAFVADLSRGTAQKQELLLDLNRVVREKTGISTDIFSRSSHLWDLCQETFQEWYLGDGKIYDSIGRKAYQQGKRGFLNDEIPIVEPSQMKEMFTGLKERGILLGIGTGRPQIETVEPLRAMGLLDCFDYKRIVTASHVLAAEREFPERAPLAKPQPFCYVLGMLGLTQSAGTALNYALPVENGEEILIVGDSVADFMAARSMGVKFAATLTGLTGLEARSKFEELGADYILTNVLEVSHLLG